MRTPLCFAMPKMSRNHAAARCLLAGVLACLALSVQPGFAAETGMDEVGSDDMSNSALELEPQDYFADSEFEVVAFQQPGTARPPTATRRPTRRPVAGQETAIPTAEDVGDYLASAPRMFGHFFGPIGQLRASMRGQDGLMGEALVTDLPSGGTAPLQIGDNNTPLPQSRFMFNYNHFENALQTRAGGQTSFLPIDQYTIGVERAFYDDILSWQLQLPFAGTLGVAGDPGFSTGRVGNLGFVGKASLWRSDYALLAGGLGLDLPTGADVNGQVGGTQFRLDNTALTVIPYLGFMVLPTDATFFQTFLTVNVPASGNQFLISPSPGAPLQEAGIFNSRTLMHLDLALGTWLFQNPGSGGITGVALVGEVHYVAALQPGDSLSVATVGTSGPTFFQLGNLSNQQTVTNFTVGIHTVWNDVVQFRVGGAFPLAERPNRSFDGEIIAQVNIIP